MSINWEAFEEHLQELHEELLMSSPSQEAFKEDFTKEVDQYIDDHGLSQEDYEKALDLARRYGYQVQAEDDDTEE